MPLLITYLKIIVKLDIELIQYKPLIYTHSLKSVYNTPVILAVKPQNYTLKSSVVGRLSKQKLLIE